MILMQHGFTEAGAPGAPAGENSADPLKAGFSRWKEKQRYTVFLVEDDSDDRNTILYTLKRSPLVHNVHWFNSGDSMLRHFVHEEYYRDLVLLRTSPLLVLLDIRIPGTDGLGILKTLREDALTEDIFVAMITGCPTAEMEERAFKLGANACIGKPLALERVHEVILTGKSWPGRQS